MTTIFAAALVAFERRPNLEDAIASAFRTQSGFAILLGVVLVALFPFALETACGPHRRRHSAQHCPEPLLTIEAAEAHVSLNRLVSLRLALAVAMVASPGKAQARR